MKTKKAFISLVLDTLFPHPAIPLSYTNRFSFLVAVLLSAQCTDARVNQVTPLLFASGDSPQAILALGQTKLEAILKPLGLYRTKARNLLKLSEILIADYQGKIPKTLEELEKLPGVGHKTASVVMSQIYKQSAFPVDTHIHRLAKRWALSSGKHVERTEQDLKKFFPEGEWGKRHLQMIYYARAYCPARAHQVEKCPICLALQCRKKA